MGRDWKEFDPEAPKERQIGREMVEESVGLGSVVAHMYRGEIAREVSWRERLDSTTNWVVTIIAAILAYAFSSDEVAHAIIIVAMLVGVVFVLIEGRRFQQYDVWRSRVRSMQENLFADALDPSQGVEQRDWRRQLSEDYRNPTMKISLQVAVSHRLRRVYLPLLIGLLIMWFVRLGGEGESIVTAAAVAGTPGWLVLTVVLAGYVCLFVVAMWPYATSPSEIGGDTDRGDLDS